ncbi:cadherin-like domain-containing protein [Polaromonas sp. YR568]|uniref:cadherin-like domain-containing protein n=1 Tax=Polaromonas sp. YR568 TaxID=1855301 RepID=UPI00398BFD3E
MGETISDGPGKSHSWKVLSDGSVERTFKEDYGTEGSRTTVTSFAKGEVIASQERQTVRDQNGVLSDILLKPDGKGEWAMVKYQLGGLLDLPAARAEFNPLPSSGTAGNSYTIQPGDSLWKIGKSIGLSDSETALFIRDTEANARASGAGGSINDLKPGNTLALPDWVRSTQELRASQRAQEGFRQAEIEAQNFAEPDPVFKSLVDEIKAFLQKPLPDALAVVADAGTGTQTDAAQNASHPATPAGPAQPVAGPIAPVFNVAGISASDLASQFIGGNAGGAHGAGQLAGFDVLPLNGNSSFLVNADGDIAAEINRLPNGYYQVKDLGGNAVYVNAKDASVLTQEKYGQAQAQAAAQAVQAGQLANAVGLMNSIIGLQHWDNMSDLQRTAVIASIYNVADKLTEGALPGDLGTAASALGLLNALDKGDVGSILVSSVSLINSVTDDMASKAIGSAFGMDAANVVPGIGLVMAISTGDPWAMLAAAANFIPIYGQFLSVAISVFGSAFGDDPPDIPTREGLAHAEWDAAGNTLVITDQDIEGGGPTATAWMTSMVNGLQAQLANVHDAAGNSYALVPDLLPAIGFQYNPDGYDMGNGGKGFVYLKWTDENGQAQTRYYDGTGGRNDGTGETLAGDFMQQAAGAIAPAWAVATALAHYQQGEGIHLPGTAAGMPQQAADGIHQTLQAITLTLPVEPALQDALIDVDADGYLERTQWLATNQGALAIDADGNNQIGVNELLSLDGPASLHDLRWLDANGDQVLDNRDPVFPAVRYWVDINADANSTGETRTLAQTGIVAIDFGSNPPAVVHADGRRTALTVQTLTGDVLGVKYEAVEGGVLQLDEQASGPAVATLHAVNTREFDGQAGHIHGGAADTDGGEETVNAGEDRLVTTSANTIATQSAQTSATLATGDARIRVGATGSSLAGQGATQTAGAAQARNNGIVFVPAGAVGVGAQMREATGDMVRSADAASFAPLAAVAAGAVAVQWPAVASAASQALDANTPPAAAPMAHTAAGHIDWQTWGGSRAGAAVPGSPTPGLQQTVAPITWDPRPGQVGVSANAASEPPAPLEWASPTITPPANATNGRLPAPAPAPTTSEDDNEAQANRAANPLALSTSTLLDYPEVHGEQAGSLEDTRLRFLETLLLANDSTVNAPAHPDEPSLRISSVFAPVHGSVSLQTNAQGLVEVVFLPEANYHGPASFDYTVTDQYGLSNNARMSLDIGAVNDAPVTQDGNVSSVEDTVLYFAPADLLASASDVDTATDGQQLSISAITAAQHGVAVFMPNDRIRFTPDADYNQSIDGLASFTYSVSDGAGGVTPATVWLSLAPVNDAPRLQDESTHTLEDQALSINPADLLANDIDVDNLHADLRISAVSDAVHGSVALQTQADGSSRIVFTPEANYHGMASFRYTVTDPDGASSTATAQVVLAAVNDAPVTQGETASGNEDTALLFTAARLLANDSDVDTAVDGDVLRITRVGMAEHGQVFLQSDGTVRFEPDADYNGPAKFSYWVGDRDPAQIAAGEGYETAASVNLTILAVNDLPVVTGETIDGDEDIILNINPALLLANDTDVDTATTNAESAQVLSITAVGNAQHGSIALLANGTLQFTPERNYAGAAGFSYTVNDGHGGLVQGQVALNLAPINDAPDVLGETVTFNEDEIQTLAQAGFLANDSDVDNPQNDLRIVSVENATHGAVSLNPNGTIRFAPDADYFGPAQFTYTVSDGSGGFTVGLASLDIAAVNDAPRLVGEALALDEDTGAHFAVDALLANDADVDNPHTHLAITAAGNASHGGVQIVAGEIVFTPDLNYNGTANFTYTVSDGAGGTSQATVNLTFNPVNDAPVANSELLWGKQGVTYTLTQAALLANDTDVESPTALRVNAISNVQHGTAVLNGDGSVRFTPEAGYAGRGSFDYLVQDPAGASSSATAQIDFSRVNVNPTATDDSFTGYEDIPFSITQAQLLVNDSDTDNASTDLRVTAVGGASNGTVSLQGDGSVRFVPGAEFSGAAGFSYLVSDGDGGQTWATARLNVQAVNDAPIIDDIIYGRPVYGYLPGAISTQDIAIYDKAQGLALAISGALYSRTYRSIDGDSEGLWLTVYDYAMVVPSYYRNGDMRPVFVETLDATFQDLNNYETKWKYPGDGTRPTDDPYRQNGYIVAYDPDGNSAAISFAIAGSPQHGHAWANQFTALSTPRDSSYSVAHWYAVGQTGAWQYYSQRGDPYSGADPFTVAVTDGGGATTYVTINTAQVGSFAPVALDLDGGGLQYLSLDESRANFDVDQKSGSEHLAWVAPADALLARDVGGDKLINRTDEISFTGYLPGAKTDLEGLAAFDSNNNHMLDRGDDKWNEFGAWQDKNSNGISETGEFKTLDEIGITQIELQSDQQVRQPAQGVTELGQSRMTWADGRTSAVGDVVFAVEQADHPPASPAAETAIAAPALPTPEHMALLMVQVISTATAAWEAAREGGPLAWIETSDPRDVHQSLAAAQAEWMQTAQAQAGQLHGAAS